MKKSISILLCFMLIIGISMNLSAQSDDEELDQLELLSQFIGTWELAISDDTVIAATITPFGKSMVFKQENKANGVTYSSYIALWALSSNNKIIEQVGIGDADDEGALFYEYGRFTAPNKFMSESVDKDTNHATRLSEFEFQSPQLIKYRIKWRGEKMTWDDEWTPHWTLIKID